MIPNNDKFTHISLREWYWLSIIIIIVLIIVLLPLFGAIASVPDNWQMMGITSNHKDGSTYLAKMNYGRMGHWQYALRHTPQDHKPAWVFSFYLVMGNLAGWLGISNIWFFHLLRLMTTSIMLIAIYWLGSQIWEQVQYRRYFLLGLILASGLGWLAVIIMPGVENYPPDLVVPEAFPLYAALANPHFPLSIGLLCFAGGIVWHQFIINERPQYPSLSNGGLLVAVMAFLNGTIMPPAQVALVAALSCITLIRWYQMRSLPIRDITWLLLLGIPPLPVWLYLFHTFSSVPFWSAFNEQNLTPTPILFFTLSSYAVILVAAAPALLKTINSPTNNRGNLLMLLWLVINFAAIYTPYALQRRFFIGLIIPLVYFAIQSVKHWSTSLRPSLKKVAFIGLIIAILPSHLIGFIAPIAVIAGNPEEAMANGLILPEDYEPVFQWLEEHAATGQVVLASPTVSRWLPGRTGVRVVYGHEFESVPNEKLERLVRNFYSGRESCNVFLQADFAVDYVIWGYAEEQYGGILREKDLKNALQDCFDDESVIGHNLGDVVIYAIDRKEVR